MSLPHALHISHAHHAVAEAPGRHADVVSGMGGGSAVRVGGVELAEALRLLRQGDRGAPELGDAPDSVVLQRVIDGLCALSSRDGLTGLSNRRSFRSELEREIERSARTGGDFGLLLIDIDHFKRVNDAHGHVAGDRVLCAVAKLLEGSFRPMDTVARFGGEEFAAIMPNSSLLYSRQIAERVNARIARKRVAVSPGLAISVTASIGVTCARAWLSHEADALVEAVDQNLYRAKRQGRNCIVWDQQPDSALTGGERSLLLEMSE